MGYGSGILEIAVGLAVLPAVILNRTMMTDAVVVVMMIVSSGSHKALKLLADSSLVA